MAHRRSKATMMPGRTVQQFPREADAEFGVVPDAEIAEWREKLSRRFGIGQGKLRVIDDPVHADDAACVE